MNEVGHYKMRNGGRAVIDKVVPYVSKVSAGVKDEAIGTLFLVGSIVGHEGRYTWEVSPWRKDVARFDHHRETPFDLVQADAGSAISGPEARENTRPR